jgi:AcrR family transcriptional regulator
MEYNEKQTAIINTAEKLFAVTGFDGTSVRDIAQEAGVNVAMISYYFGSKEKLMEAVVEERTSHIKLKVENLLQDGSLSNIQKVFILIDEYVNKFIEHQQFHKIMIREQMTDKSSVISEAILEIKKRNLSSIKQLILAGQKTGEFKKNIDVVLMLTTLIGTVSQMVTSQCFYRDVNNLEQMKDPEFRKYMKKKLSVHLKHLFKVILTNEA